MSKSVDERLADISTQLTALTTTGVKVDLTSVTTALTGIQNGVNQIQQDIELPPAAVPAIGGALSPAGGSTAGGETVTVTGTGFEGVTGVLVGTVAATNVVVVSDTSLTYTSPAQGVGPEDVTIVGPGGTSPVVPAGVYTYA